MAIDKSHAPVSGVDLVKVYDLACNAWTVDSATQHEAGLLAVADEGVRRYIENKKKGNATERSGWAMVDEDFLRRAATAMKHGPEGLGNRGDCDTPCSKCQTEKLLDSVRTTAKPGDTYIFNSGRFKVTSVEGFGQENLVFFEDGTHARQRHLKPSMRA